MYRFKIDRINDYKRTLKYKINRRIKFRLDTYIRQSLSIIDYRCEIDVIVTSRNVPPCSRHFPPFPIISIDLLPRDFATSQSFRFENY